MIWFIFFICILLLLHDRRTIVPVFFIASMWINTDVRCGTLSFISMLSIFIVLFGLYTQKKNLTYKTNIDRTIIRYFIYAIFVNVPFILLSTDLSVLSQINAIKSQILSVILAFFIWRWTPYDTQTHKRQLLFINVSIIILCFYGIYSYFTMSNPYMDIMEQYCTMEDLSDILTRSMEDARGNLHGRITGTSLYTIQYGILLVLVIFIYQAFSAWNKSKVMQFVILILVLINIYLTGSRGPLGALLVGMAYYLMRSLSWKKRVTYTLAILFFIFVGWPYFESYFSLFTDSDISGSSFEMRVAQFGGALSMVSNNIQSLLFGKGFGYTAYYLTNYGIHPVAYSFESTHVSGIVNYGILGLIFIFLCNILFLYYVARKAYNKELIDNNSYFLLSSYLIAHVVYNLLVGNVYNGLFLFGFFVILKMCIAQKRKINS